MTYYVEVAEVYKQIYSVTADSPEEAKRLIDAGEGEIYEDNLEFSHQLNDDEYAYTVYNESFDLVA